MQLWRLRRKVHASWLIALASSGVVIGASAVPIFRQVLFGSVIWLAISLVLIGIVLWRSAVYILPLALIAGLVLGLWRGSLLQSQLVGYPKLVGKSVRATGKVTDDPDTGKKGGELLRIGSVVIGKHPLAGKIWVSLIQTADIKRGDIVTVSGKLSPGFGSFSAVMYEPRLVRVNRPQPGDIARQLRDGFADDIRKGINEPQASLGLGYLLGQRRALPPELTSALVATGLTHVVVASGYNLTILVRLARRLFVKISKYLATVSASAMIVGFMAVTGSSPSMVRAGLVSGLSLAAWYYGRRFHPLVLLPLAAALTVLIDPTYAWNDLGWQLSFAAFAGVMLLAPLLQRYFFGKEPPGIVRQILGETISASIVTLPIIIMAFGQFSNVAIATNLLILPLVPLAMLLTFITGLGGLIVPALAPLIGAPAQWLLKYMTSVIDYFAALPWAQTIIEIQPWMVVAAYGIIIVACLYLWRATKYDFTTTSIVD